MFQMKVVVKYFGTYWRMEKKKKLIGGQPEDPLTWDVYRPSKPQNEERMKATARHRVTRKKKHKKIKAYRKSLQKQPTR